MGEANNINVKKVGIGTLSLIISIFSVMFSFRGLANISLNHTIRDFNTSSQRYIYFT
ncbi:hypothetical protein [Clostridium lacusfryxellense]|uniref:hypothetical protein n=1 Tax=Clostridium lacusfryxellense TaxID=205328 RepID=UPI001C0D5D12|nr:hypothetical protein [Clostridium lacusfryxellense]MBU3114698.1 hypothetical protein [Clostridium lacusfryxellense]